jgi:transcriptional regulator with XRE-family HTH domain
MYTDNDRRINTMGNRIKEVRKSKGITQKELAEKLGVTPQAVSQFEKTDSAKFNVSTLQNIAAALDCTINDLVDSELYSEISGIKELIDDPRDKRLMTYLLQKSSKLNRMGYDALANYLDLLVNAERYTSREPSYLKETWGLETYEKYYSKKDESPDKFDTYLSSLGVIAEKIGKGK